MLNFQTSQTATRSRFY